MSSTRELVDLCSSLTYEDFSLEVIDRIKYHTLDFIGVAARGSLLESSQMIYDLVRDIGQSPKGSVVIGTNTRARCQYAALANGTAAHSIEMDDDNEGHPGAVVFPTALAASELTSCDWEKFGEGIVLGYEVLVRLVRLLRAQSPANPYARGFYPTGVCGSFAAAVAASRILDLNKEQQLNALGIAGSQASGVMEFMTEGTWTHRLNTGWAAHNGIIAALLGKRGYRGPSTIIEGRWGFLHCFSSGFDLSNFLDKWSDPYEITKTGIKPYACCSFQHNSIDCILRIMKEHNLKAEEVDKVTCGIPKMGWDIVAAPIESKRNPKGLMDAQVSMPFGAAVALIYGRATIDEYGQENINSPRVKELMARVSCVEDPGPEQGIRRPPSVEIVTKDGKRFLDSTDHPKGNPENPLSWDELIAKYNNLSSSVYSEERRDEILERIKKLDSKKKVADFCSLLLRDT